MIFGRCINQKVRDYIYIMHITSSHGKMWQKTLSLSLSSINMTMRGRQFLTMTRNATKYMVHLWKWKYEDKWYIQWPEMRQSTWCLLWKWKWEDKWDLRWHKSQGLFLSVKNKKVSQSVTRPPIELSVHT